MSEQQVRKAYHEACHAIFILSNVKHKALFLGISDNQTYFADDSTLCIKDKCLIGLAGKIGVFFFFNEKVKTSLRTISNEGLFDFKRVLKFCQFNKDDFKYEITAKNIAFLQPLVSNIIQTLYSYQEEIRLLVQCYLINDNHVSREQAFYIIEHKTLPPVCREKNLTLFSMQNLLTTGQCAQTILNPPLFLITDIFKIEIAEINMKLQCHQNASEVHKKLVAALVIAEDLAKIRVLLKTKFVNYNFCNKNGDSLLMLAVETQCQKIIEELLKYDVDVNFINPLGNTILHVAVLNSNFVFISSLINYPGLVINKQNASGATALMLAAINGYDDIVEILLKHQNIATNLKNKSGATALMLAALNGYVKVVKLLLYHDENISHTMENMTNFFTLRPKIKFNFKEEIISLISESYKRSEKWALATAGAKQEPVITSDENMLFVAISNKQLQQQCEKNSCLTSAPEEKGKNKRAVFRI